jgi:peptidyl-tRNA hydrolase
MSPGKIVAQAGHAYLGAFLRCKDAAIIAAYHKDFPHSPGTKVCLKARHIEHLLIAEGAARHAGLPVFRVVDSGCEDFYGGEPIITALGIGPATKEQVHRITRKFQLL